MTNQVTLALMNDNAWLVAVMSKIDRKIILNLPSSKGVPAGDILTSTIVALGNISLSLNPCEYLDFCQ